MQAAHWAPCHPRPDTCHAAVLCLQACADKLAREIATYGNPPVFPTEEEEAAAQPQVSRGWASARGHLLVLLLLAVAACERLA